MSLNLSLKEGSTWEACSKYKSVNEIIGQQGCWQTR